MKKSFEDIIKSKSKGYEKEPPTEVWNRVREQLPRNGGHSWVAVIVSVAAIISAILLVIFPSEKKNTIAVSNVNLDTAQAISTKKGKADSAVASVSKISDQKGKMVNNGPLDDDKEITPSPMVAPEDLFSGRVSTSQKLKLEKQVLEKSDVPAAEKSSPPAENSKGIVQTDSAGSENIDSEKKQVAPVIPADKTTLAGVPETSDSSDGKTSSQTKTNSLAKQDKDKKGKDNSDPNPKHLGRLSFEIQAGYTQSKGQGMDYQGPDNSNGFRWVPLADNFDPASAAYMDYETHRNTTDRNVKLPHYGLQVHYRLSTLLGLSSGISWFSLGRQISGDYALYQGSYSSSIEGDIKMDSGTMFPLIEPSGQSYFTPFGSNSVLQQYGYISIPLQVHFQAFSFRDFSFNTYLGMEYNLYKSNTSLYYFDYNNYRYFKLTGAEQKKYLKAQIFSFSPGLSLQYRLGNFHVSSYAQYSFIPGSVYTGNSYIQEYYKAFRYGLGFGYTLNAVGGKKQDRRMK